MGASGEGMWGGDFGKENIRMFYKTWQGKYVHMKDGNFNC